MPYNLNFMETFKTGGKALVGNLAANFILWIALIVTGALLSATDTASILESLMGAGLLVGLLVLLVTIAVALYVQGLVLHKLWGWR